MHYFLNGSMLYGISRVLQSPGVPKNWLKLGISWQIKEGKYNDKSTIYLLRQYFPVLKKAYRMDKVMKMNDHETAKTEKIHRQKIDILPIT